MAPAPAHRGAAHAGGDAASARQRAQARRQPAANGAGTHHHHVGQRRLVGLRGVGEGELRILREAEQPLRVSCKLKSNDYVAAEYGEALSYDAAACQTVNRRIIETTTPDKMRVIQQRYYVPNNTALIVTGGIAPNLAGRLTPLGAELAARPPAPRLPRCTQALLEQSLGAAGGGTRISKECR